MSQPTAWLLHIPKVSRCQKMKNCVLSSTPKLIPGFCLFPGVASSLPHATPNVGGLPPAPQVPPTGYLTKLDKLSPTWALTCTFGRETAGILLATCLRRTHWGFSDLLLPPVASGRHVQHL